MKTKEKTRTMPKTITSILKQREGTSCELIEVLQDVQKSYNHLPEDILRIVAEKLDTPLIEVFWVAIFYKAFTLTP